MTAAGDNKPAGGAGDARGGTDHPKTGAGSAGRKARRETARRLLAGAYKLGDPESHRKYYAEFAEHFDTTFATGLGYVAPSHIAKQLAAMRMPEGRVLDVGCGTGLVAEEIRGLLPMCEIDGVDISREMLDVAGAKDIYRALIEADLTADFSHLPGGYAGLVSAGTFTLGHLGPEPIGPLLDHCADGAAVVIGINAKHFEARDFAGAMKRLVDDGRIDAPDYDEVPIYDGSDPEHAGDRAWIMSFRVLGR